MRAMVLRLLLMVMTITSLYAVRLPHERSFHIHVNPSNEEASSSTLLLKLDEYYQAASITLFFSSARSSLSSGYCDLQSCAPHPETLAYCALWTKVDFNYEHEEGTAMTEIRFARPVRSHGFNLTCTGLFEVTETEVHQDPALHLRERRRDVNSPYPIRIVSLSRLIPYYTRFDVWNWTTHSSAEMTFAGYTISMNIALFKADQVANTSLYLVRPYTSAELTVRYETTLALDRIDLNGTESKEMYRAVYGMGEITDLINTGDQFLLDLQNNMTRLLNTNIIRSKPVMDVLMTLYCNNNQSQLTYPIALVGGTVRDLANNKDVNDIDVAISKPFSLTVFTLNDFFNYQGLPVAPNTIQADGTRKNYGMIKVDKMVGDSDSLDVGIMKSVAIKSSGFSWGDWTPTAEEKDSYYLYGFSYATDSMSRDYTINAVYMNPIGPGPRIIDPSGSGFDDIKNKKVRLIPDNEQQFTRDYGGWFRFFKEKSRANYHLANKSLSEKVCGYIDDKLGLYAQGHTGNESTPSAPYFFNKLRKKLFPVNGNLDSYSIKLKGISETIKNLNESLCAKMWNDLVSLTQSDVIRNVTGVMLAEKPDDYAVLLLIQAIAKQPTMDYIPALERPARSTFNFVLPDQIQSLPEINGQLQQELCRVSFVQARVLPQMPFIPPTDDPDDDDTYGGSSDLQGFCYPLMADWEIDTENPAEIIYANKLIVVLASMLRTLNTSEPIQALVQSFLTGAKDITAPISFLRTSPAADIARFVSSLYNDPVSIARMLIVIAPMSAYQNPEVSQVTDQLMDITFEAKPYNVGAHKIVLSSRLPSSVWPDFGIYNPHQLPVFLPLDHVPSTNAVSVFLHFVYAGNHPPQTDLSADEWLDVLTLESYVLKTVPEKCPVTMSSQQSSSMRVTYSFLLLLVSAVIF